MLTKYIKAAILLKLLLFKMTVFCWHILSQSDPHMYCSQSWFNSTSFIFKICAKCRFMLWRFVCLFVKPEPLNLLFILNSFIYIFTVSEEMSGACPCILRHCKWLPGYCYTIDKVFYVVARCSVQLLWLCLLPEVIRALTLIISGL